MGNYWYIDENNMLHVVFADGRHFIVPKKGTVSRVEDSD